MLQLPKMLIHTLLVYMYWFWRCFWHIDCLSALDWWSDAHCKLWVEKKMPLSTRPTHLPPWGSFYTSIGFCRNQRLHSGIRLYPEEPHFICESLQVTLSWTKKAFKTVQMSLTRKCHYTTSKLYACIATNWSWLLNPTAGNWVFTQCLPITSSWHPLYFLSFLFVPSFLDTL